MPNLALSSIGITFPDATTQTTSATASGAIGTTQLSSGVKLQIAKAWVKFDANGTVSASYNVSSVTKNSGGNFTVNMTNALSSANYSVTAGVSLYGNQTFSAGYGIECISLTSSTFGVMYYTNGYSAAIYSAQVFGN